MPAGVQMRWWFIDRFTSSPTGRRVAVSGERFASVMHRMGVRASVDVPDRLGSAPTRHFDIEFERPRALRVTDLIEGEPALRDLKALADRLRKERDVTVEAAAARVEAVVGKGQLSSALIATATPTAPDAAITPRAPAETPAPQQTPESNAPDIFARVEMPTASTLDVARSGVDAFVGAVLGRASRSRPTPTSSAPVRKSAADLIEQAVTATALDILEHPDVAGLEASWRGLKMVVAASPGHDQLAIDLVDVGVDGLTHTWTLPASSRERPDAIFIGPSLQSVGDVVELAALAERERIPVVVAVDESLPFADLDDLAASDASPSWTELRAQSSSAWICATMNPVVLVHEVTPQGPRFLGGSPAFAVAAMLAAALERDRGLQSVGGPRHAFVAPAAHDIEIAPGEQRTVPTAYFAPWALQNAAARLGVTLLGSEAGSDRVIVADTPMVHGPQAALVQRIRSAFAARSAT